ncbi:MAG: peptidase domain-containing ABC transporter [Chloroflexota bacterium]
MTNGPRSPFREAALRRHMQARNEPVLPRLAAPVLDRFLWLMLPVLSWLASLPPISGLLARLGHGQRVPVVLQMTWTECGAACLAMILGYHGRSTPLAECRNQCGAGRDGVTVRAITQAARAFGLRVKAYSLQLEDLQHVTLPAIIHWRFNHYVVLERWSPDGAEIVDPAVGRRQISPAELDEGFTGVTITFEPGVEFERRRSTARSVWRDFLAYVLRTPGAYRLLAQVLGASLVLQLLGLALPYFTGVLIDRVVPLQLDQLMAILGLGMLGVVLARTATTYARAALLVGLRARLDTQMILGFVEHVLQLPYPFFQGRRSGDLLARLSSNTMIREALTGQTLSAVLDGGLVVVYLAVLAVQAPFFGSIVLALAALQIGLLLLMNRRLYPLVQRDLVAQTESQSYLMEMLRGIGTLKAAGAEDAALDRWSNLFYTHLNVSVQRGQLLALGEAGVELIRTLSPLLLLWLGAQWVLDGTLSLGTMLALNMLGAAVLQPLTSLVAAGQQLHLAGAHLERIADVLAARPEQEDRSARARARLQGRVELDGVSFRYDPNAPLVLRDLSVEIEAGQKVALVGRTGSGKTTLAMLLLGLYQPSQGQIRYDGTPLHDLDFRSVRRQFGIVLQESFLFSGSIRENVAFNAPDLSLEAVQDLARLAGIHDEIAQMPMRYETLVAEGGAALSGGQRQRLSIARALAHQPAILLLDEATSSLDTVTERIVDGNLGQLDCTRIVIAHRLSTVRNADLILVLEDGAIVERGTHDELLQRGGTYAALVQTQLLADAAPASQSQALATPA